MATPFPFTAGAVLTAAQMNAITELVINDKTASYTLTAAEAGDYVIMNSASATTITVPASVFTASQVVYIVNKGTANTVITAGAGVTISSSGSLTVPANGAGRLLALSASAFIYEAAGITVTSGVVQVKSVTKTDAFSTSSTSFTDITGLSISITPTSASNNILVLTGLAISASAYGRVHTQLVRASTNIATSTGFAGSNQTSCAFDTNYHSQYVSISHLDSPTTTSATTYKMQLKLSGASTALVNSQAGASDQGNVSTLTVMEVTP